MGVRVLKVFEYTVECNGCLRQEVYHTNDQDNGVRVHTLRTALKASGFKRMGGKVYCPDCYDEEVDRRADRHG